MKSFIMLCALAIMFCQVSHTQSHSAALESLVRAEQAFAAASMTSGIKTAFLTYLADDGIIFRPGPINGKEFWQKRDWSTATLEWRPTFADVASSGELGWTMGPSVFTPPPNLDQPPTYSQFVSLWRIQKSGEWKVVLDAGVSHPFSGALDTTLVLGMKRESRATQHQDIGRASVLLQLERVFSTLSSKKGSVAAYSRYLASDARVLREGHLPAVGFDSCVALIRSFNDILTWAPIESHVADSFDLGYTYGTYQSIREKGYYIHIWRKQESGALKVVLDMLLPSPLE
jgi:ketosteroid isomerase-like protein